MRRLTHAASNDNCDLVAAVTRELIAAMRRQAMSASFAARERSALQLSNEAVRRALEAFLQELADNAEDEVDLGTERYRRHQAGEVNYHSLCGALHVRRWTYRQVGVRNGPTIVPLELRAGLIENATPALAYAVAHGYATAPTRGVRRDLEVAHRAPSSRATLERMAKAIGTDAKRLLMDLERSVRASEELPAKATGITLGMDRTSVPMEEEADAVGPSEERQICVRYRMAYVGTVALTARDGTMLKSWKYAGPAHEGPLQIVRRMMNDLSKVRRAKPRIRIGVVQDGAPELWTLMEDALRAQPRIRWRKAIDMYHLSERLSKALEIVEPDQKKRASQLALWKTQLVEDDRAIAGIAKFFELGVGWLRSTFTRHRQALKSVGWVLLRNGLMRRRCESDPPPPPPPAPRRWNQEQATALSDLLSGYLANPEYFRYATLRRFGLHVGSGITEGACKSLIAIRAKRSGQRWRTEGITAVLTLRSLVESNRFDAFWSRFARRHAPLAQAA